MGEEIKFWIWKYFFIVRPFYPRFDPDISSQTRNHFVYL